MALECDPPHLGDIGDREADLEAEDDLIDWRYDAWAEKQIEEGRR